MQLDNLQEIGLSAKEAAVCTALVRLGQTTVQAIAQNTGINRASVYSILKSLMDKQLVTLQVKKGVKTYKAVTPDAFLQTVSKRLETKKVRCQHVKKMLPELKKVYQKHEFTPKVRIFEGKKAIIDTFDESLDSNIEKALRVYTPVDIIFNYLPEYLPKFVERMRESGIRQYGIHPDDESVKLFLKTYPFKTNKDEAILIPRDRFKFASSIAVYDDKISVVSYKDEFGVIVQGKYLADVVRELFDLARIEAKRLQKENRKTA